VEHGKLIVVVGLPREMDPHSVDHHWTGIFTSNDKSISGADFVVAGVIRRDQGRVLRGDAAIANGPLVSKIGRRLARPCRGTSAEPPGRRGPRHDCSARILPTCKRHVLFLGSRQTR
jgi:hypothetical protein